MFYDRVPLRGGQTPLWGLGSRERVRTLHAPLVRIIVEDGTGDTLLNLTMGKSLAKNSQSV